MDTICNRQTQSAPHGIDSLGGGLTAATLSGLLVAICLSQTGSLFSADSWHNIAFATGEVKRPERNITLAMVIGATAVIVLYILANIAYLVTLPLAAIQQAPAGRVGTATLQAIFPRVGTSVMAAAIMVSTFGTINALTLTGARAYYAMARQRLFFPFAGKLNTASVPASSLKLQGLWAALLVLPRTYDPATQRWGNLYSSLLEYVISAALIFYVLTVAGVFRLRITRPNAPRPYRTIGYPVVPGLYIFMASAILAILFAYRPATTWPGLLIVLLGIPIYLLIVWADRGRMQRFQSREPFRMRSDRTEPEEFRMLVNVAKRIRRSPTFLLRAREGRISSCLLAHLEERLRPGPAGHKWRMFGECNILYSRVETGGQAGVKVTL